MARGSTEPGSGVAGYYWGRVRLPRPVSIGIRHSGLGLWLLLKRSSEISFASDTPGAYLVTNSFTSHELGYFISH